MSVADDLATLREAIYLSKPHHGLERDHDDYEWRVDLALEAHKRVEAEAARLRDGLRRIRSWDCLNPPRADLLADLPWLARELDALLAEDSAA